MPYSFTTIERRKSYVIHAVFGALFILYFLFGIILFLGGKLAVYGFIVIESDRYGTLLRHLPPFFTLREFAILAGLAFLVALGHWTYVAQNLLTRVIGAVRAEIPNPGDKYHQMYVNIADELAVATGGKKFTALIIPSMAMNACAASDFEGHAVICVTEGVLAKLTRAQIEAVMAHEAAHVLEGDSVETTLTVSLFNLMSEFLDDIPKKFARALESQRLGYYGLYVVAVTMLVYLGLQITRLASLVLNMFMSRQREFRADAIAVRLTRDPLALAEALHIISNNWRGAGLPGQKLGPLFIVNHKHSELAESNSLMADLFATHPPVRQRLGILLDMAHVDKTVLDAALAKCAARPREIHAYVAKPQERRWLFHKEGQWLGPFGVSELAGLDWIRPDMLVKRLGGPEVLRAAEDKELLADLQAVKKSETLKTGDYHCPRCHVPLLATDYESTVVHTCPSCLGYLVGEEDLTRIIAREDMGFGKEIEARARKIQKEKYVIDYRGQEPLYAADGLRCPRCRHPRARMVRMFYSVEYRVEIDKCLFCGLVWFDKDELDVLQFLIEEGRRAYKHA